MKKKFEAKAAGGSTAEEVALGNEGDEAEVARV
jgi:hypothetical protein